MYQQDQTAIVLEKQLTIQIENFPEKPCSLSILIPLLDMMYSINIVVYSSLDKCAGSMGTSLESLPPAVKHLLPTPHSTSPLYRVAIDRIAVVPAGSVPKTIRTYQELIIAAVQADLAETLSTDPSLLISFTFPMASDRALGARKSPWVGIDMMGLKS